MTELKPLHVAISGATSFTGLWIAEYFREQGCHVSALCSQDEKEYSGLRKLRVHLLKEKVKLYFGIRAEDGGMDRWITQAKPDIWIHHHFWMENFRAATYDIKKAEEIGLDPLPGIIKSLKDSGCRGVIYSGTFFEPGEGGIQNDENHTLYAKMKQNVWKRLSELAGNANLKLSKVVIPNPIGPMENEDRLVPTLLKKCNLGEPLVLKAPEAVSDYLPVRSLAAVYYKVAQELYEGREMIARPSGWIGTTENWVKFANEELLERRLKLKGCEIRLESNGSGRSYQNPIEEKLEIDWGKEWDHYSTHSISSYLKSTEHGLNQ